ncbi:MAG TPA: NB-ARC domain-containing protein, partial [Allocoleopsis sp.]
MDFEEAYRVADEAVFAHRAKRLTDAETTVLRGAWRTQSYEEIANHSQYSLNYLKRDVGPKLWRSLSEALGEEVGKTNFREALERRKQLGMSQSMSQGTFPGLPTAKNPSPPTPSAKSVSSKLLSKDWGESFDISKSFYGRTEELAQLETWALTDRCRLLGIFGRGGMGKTSLAAKLADQIKDQFEFFIWRSLRYSPHPTEIFEEIIAFLSQHQEADIPTDPHAAIGLLLQYLRKRRCLVVLDSAEMVLQPDDRTGRYLPGFEAYGELFTRVGREPHQSCLVLTSREKLKEFTAYEGDALPIRSLQLQGLDQAAARAVLQDKGFPKLEDADRLLIQSYAGNPYDFKIAASAIKNLFSNRITDFLATNTLVFDSIRILLDKQFERLSSAEKEIIYWLAIYRETVTLTELRRAILLPPLRQTNLLEALYALGRRSLVENQPDGFTLQPTVLEYITQDLIEQIYQEITTEQINLLNSHALTQAKGNDYIRTLQIHTILRPLLDRLLIDFDNVTQLKNRLLHLLETWRNHCSVKPGYLGSNILSLLRLLSQDLDG